MTRRSGSFAAGTLLFVLIGVQSAHGSAVIATNPLRNAKSASRSTNIQATADGNVESATVTQSTFRIQGNLTGRVAGAYTASGPSFQLDPTSNLKPGELIHVTATSGIQDTSSVPLTKSVWQFRAATNVATGGLKAHPAAPSFGASNSYAVALGDIDGDGDLDAIVANGGTTTDPETVWKNDGTGAFTSFGSFGGVSNSSSVDVALGDIDNDGDLDVVVANATAQPESVWTNDGTGVFTAHSTFGTGDSHAIVLGDLDGDGDLDAVVANYFQGESETSWLNDGAGNFTLHQTFGSNDSYTAALGDLDSDGDLDLVVGNVSAGETVWLNNGSGTFALHSTPSFDGGDVAGMDIGDVNNDGHLDLLLSRFSGAASGVWLNDGTGIFTPHATTFGAGGDSRAAALGDLDGDGDLDAVITNAQLYKTVWLNDGAGLFTAHPTTPDFGGTGALHYSYETALGDLDGDGDLDAVVCNGVDGQAETVWINGSVRISPTSGLVTTEAGGNATFTVVLDVAPTADVSLQIDTSDSSEGRISTDGVTQLNTVTLTFTTSNWSTPRTITVHGQSDAVDDGNIAYTLTTSALTSTDPFFSGLNAADVSATNTDDDTAGVTVTPLAVAVKETGTTAGFTLVLTSEPVGDVVIDVSSGDTTEATVSPAQRTFTSANWSAPQSITVTGVNDALIDGNLNTTIAVSVNAASTADPLYDAVDPADVVATTADNDFVIVNTNPANGAKAAPRTANVTANASGGVQHSATVNQNTWRMQGELTGRIGGFYGGATGNAMQFNPTNDFKPGEKVRVTATSGILGPNDSPLVPEVWQFTAAAGAASGVFLAHATTPSFGSDQTEAAALGDLDGDGDLDAVVVNGGTDPERVWINDGTGGFAPHATAPTFNGTSGTDTAVALGDLDADGDLDAVMATYTGYATVWRNGGSGDFSAHPATPTFGSPLAMSTGVALGDLDADGDLDAVIGGDGQETVWLNDGTGSFSAHPVTPSFGGGSSTCVELGDLDDDGDLDAIVSNIAPELTTVWMNDGSGSFSAHPTAPTIDSGKTVDFRLGDLDGDNDLDAVFANYDNTAEKVFTNQGNGTFVALGTFGTGESFGVALGDVDGDGDLDAAIANFGNDTVWLNNGSGVFTLHGTFNGGSQSTDVRLGNLDGDNDLDLFMANGSGATEAETVWLNRNPAGINITPAIPFITSEFGSTSTHTIVLASAPTSNVTIQLDSSDPTEVKLSTDLVNYFNTVSVTFTPSNWSSAQTFRIKGQDDFVDDGNIPFTIITQPATSSDPLYSGLNAADLSRQNNDNDTAGITVNKALVYVNESGTSATFTVKLNSEPTTNVVLDITPSDGTEASASPATLTFTSSDWSSPQTVTITGVDDGDDDGNQTTAISVAVNIGATGDTVYQGVTATSVNVLTIDNEDVVIIATSPDGNAPSGLRSANIQATADEAMNAATATASTFRVHGSFTGPIDGTYGGSGATIHLDPQSNLKAGERIDATATSGVLSATASPLTPYVWRFTANTGKSTGALYKHPATPLFGGGDSYGGALGDIDGDGDLDAVIANFQDEAETVWVNDGLGTFTAHPTTPSFATIGRTNTVVLGDIDNDGDLDAVAGDDMNEGTTWLNDGAGSFTAHPTTPQFGSNVTKSLALGDLDADGDLDVITGNQGGSGAGVWMNDGAGNFSAHLYTPSFGSNSDCVALGDLDGDGDLDAVMVAQVAAPSGKVFLNDGFGNFAAHPTTPTFASGTAWDLTLGDIDGDGDLDAIAAISDGETDPPTVWVNNGTGGFSAHPSAPMIGTQSATSVALGDMDGDGDLDAFLADGNYPQDTLWRNNGAGVFTAHPATPIVGANGTWRALLGDVDDDGDLDAVLVNNYLNLAQEVLLNAGIGVNPRSGLVTTEDGLTDTLTIVLEAEPEANVTIPVASSDTTEALISTDGVTQQSAVNLTFTPFNWATPRTITVHGQNDGAADGNIAYTINTGTPVSSDPAFNGGDIPDVTGTNLDDDTTGVTVSPRTVSVSESGSTASFNLSLDNAPTGNVVIDVASTDPGEVTVSPAQLTFTTSDFATPQPVTVTGVNDSLNDGSQLTRISVLVNATLTADATYDAIDPPDVLATTTDNDFGIMATNPASNENAAPRSTNIEATAEGALNASTITSTNVRVHGSFTPQIAGAFTASGATLQLNPANDLKPGETVTLTATSGVQSAAAEPLLPHVWQLTAAAGQGTGAMAAQSTFGGGQIVDLALGDLDGDGDLDAVTANYSNEVDRVFLNDGTGTFSNTQTFGGASTAAVALGDLDGDGDLDVITVNVDAPSTVWVNDGNGTLSPHSTPSIGATANGIDLGDIDGDGDLDAVFSSGAVFVNNGLGTFSAHPITPNFGGGGYSVALGDVDRDGDLDAVAVNLSLTGHEMVWSNDGAGNFSLLSSFDARDAAYLALGDLDGDFDLDAVVTNATFTDGETVWLNNGYGRFFPHPTIPAIGAGIRSLGVALGDLDGDGDLDAVLAAAESDPETIWLNDGTGGLTAHPITPTVGCCNSQTVALGDVDGDGDLDAVIGHGSGTSDSVLINRNPPGINVTPTSGLITTEQGGTATFTVVLTTPPVANVSLQVQTSDATEGKLSTDGATQQTSATLTFSTSNWSAPQTITLHGQDDALDDGDIGYTITTAAATSTDGLYNGLNAADVTASNRDDERPPVVTAIYPANGPAAGGTVVTITGSNFIIGGTSVTFGGAAATNVSCSSTTSCTATSPAGTGTVALRVTNIAGISADTPADDFTYTAAPATACAAFGAPASYSTSPYSPVMTATGDFNADGKRDLAIANDHTTNVTIFLGNGNGTLGTPSSFSTGSSSRSLAVADFDEDGKSDLAVTNGSANVAVVLGNGNGTFGTAALFAVGTNPMSVVTGDFNGDGHADLATANAGSNNVSILLGLGNGTFGTATNHAVGTSPIFITGGDFNNDGRGDLVTANNSSANVSILLGNGDGSFAAASNVGSGASPWSVGVSDFNGDGRHDLAITSVAGSNAGIRLGNGDGTFGSLTSFPAADSAAGLAVGDVNGDGRSDLVVACASNPGTVSLLLGTGTGSFAAAVNYPMTDIAQAVAVADFNGDDRSDLAVVNPNYTIWIMLNTTASGTLVLSASSHVVAESAGTATITVNRTAGSDCTATVYYETSNGSATAGSDYTSTSGTLTFIAGDTSESFTVPITNDLVDEADESLNITISNPGGAVLGATTTATVTITDNDTAGVTVTPLTLSVRESGTTANFTVVLQSEPAGNVVLDLSSGDTGEATVSPAQLTFTSGTWSTPQPVTVTGVNDAVIDGNQPATISVTMNTGATIDPLYDVIDPSDVVATTIDDDFVITATSPTANAKAAPRATNVTATASGTVQPASITQSTYRVQGRQTGRIGGSYGATGTSIDLDPTTNLKPGETIQVTATSGILGPEGSALVPRVWHFTAAAGTASGVMSAQPATPSFGGGASHGVALGDLDGDGDVDAVIANISDQAETVWLNDGTGSLSAHPSIPEFGGGKSTDVALGDLDNDGDLDAVVANENLQAETVWLNNGTGGFSPHPTTSGFGTGRSYRVALGDLDGDGDLDAVVAESNSQGETVWRNDGTGSFSAHPTTPTFGAGYSGSLALGDLDGDGDLDAVVANYYLSSEAETVWLNDGGGNFTAHPVTPSFGAGSSNSLTLGDLDGDGDLDVVVANDAGQAETVWLNNGSGSFAAHPGTPSFGAGSETVEVALGDLDGDGDLDAVAANISAAETVWLNDGSGNLSAHPATASFGAQNSYDLALADLDGDGDLDVVVANQGGEAETVWLNRNPAGILVTPTSGLVTTEAGTTATFTVALTSPPVANVSMQLDTSDATEGRISTDGVTQQTAVTLTFTPANWSSAQTVTVHGQNDAVDDGNINYTITTAAATSSDPLYNGLVAAAVSASNSDDDTAGITVTPTSVTVAESGSTANFSVVLTSEPTGDVVIDLASGDTGEATVSTAQVTFTSADWSTPKNVTVTGIDDALDDGDQTTTISVGVNAGATADPVYDPIDPADVSVTTTDDDAAFGAPPNFTATATSTSTVATSWGAVAGATSYEVWRTTAINVAYTLVTTTTNTFFNDSGLSAGTTYLYKARTNGPGGPSAFTAIDPATTTIFTDPLLNTSITVKAVHVTQLRTAVNAMRAAGLLGPAAFTDPAPAIIKRIHIIELRTALDAARSAIGLAALIYTDPTITVGTTAVKKEHIAEPRAGTQ